MDVRVIVGPGVVADRGLLGEVAGREFADLGVSGALGHATSADEVRAALAGRASEAVVVVLGADPEVRRLMLEPSEGVVWVDLTRRDSGPRGVARIHGRGVSGLEWGIRHAVRRARRPCPRVPYGEHADQWAELHLPESAGPHPVVALIHGGYWRSIWGADLMDALCDDLAGRGFAAWNLEYRRPDLHGWKATTSDVAAGLAALSGVDAPLDLGRVAVAGHSAGGQLALRAAADGARMALAVSLAGVLDLVEGDRRWISSGAVAAALGADGERERAGEGEPALRSDGAAEGERASRGERTGEGEPASPGDGAGEGSLELAQASPLLRLPMRVPRLVVQGAGDDLDLVDFARRYAAAAERCGDDVTYLELPGDHFAVIDPRTPIWQATARAIAESLR
ncbi:alpha/beta hydrolase [Nonomuraea sp. NPDC000554]|uniref:alpha/beta hydrolase n=1 Tax=Nonomuraea sp. NPDC000554 TaxID=3154259 RepID=UPI003322E7D5